MAITALFATACGNKSDHVDPDLNTVEPRREILSRIDDWAIQTQNIDINEIAASRYDLVTIDVSRNGSQTTAFTKEEVEYMRGQGASHKLILAYLSLGEAESYRDYFDPLAFYLDAPNPSFPDNYRVKYWMPEWHQVVRANLDQILNTGYDGVVLDVIDAYEHFEDGLSLDGLERPTAPQEMADLVMEVAEYARTVEPEFLVVAQNGWRLLHKIETPDRYLNDIDAVSFENVFYTENNVLHGDANYLDTILHSIDHFNAIGKVAFSIEYVDHPAAITDFYSNAKKLKLLPYNPPKLLDDLVETPGYEPD